MSSEYHQRIIQGRGDHQSMWPWVVYEHCPSRGRIGTIDTWSTSSVCTCWVSAPLKGRKSLWMEMTAKQVEPSTSQSQHSLGLNKNQIWKMSLCSPQFSESELIRWAAYIIGFLLTQPTDSLLSLTLSWWFVLPNCASPYALSSALINVDTSSLFSSRSVCLMSHFWRHWIIFITGQPPPVWSSCLDICLFITTLSATHMCPAHCLHWVLICC